MANSNITHPNHYNTPGRKECWDEMADRFGVEFVKIFCKGNYFKYSYRHKEKNGDEDLAKAKNYYKKFLKLGGTPEEFFEGITSDLRDF